MNNFYSKNYKTLSKEREEEKKEKKQESILCLWTRRLNIVKKTVLTKAIYRFNAISLKISMMIFAEIGNKKS